MISYLYTSRERNIHLKPSANTYYAVVWRRTTLAYRNKQLYTFRWWGSTTILTCAAECKKRCFNLFIFFILMKHVSWGLRDFFMSVWKRISVKYWVLPDWLIWAWPCSPIGWFFLSSSLHYGWSSEGWKKKRIK